MPKVFILHDNPHAPKNFIDAERFGELQVVFNHHIGFNHINRAVASLRDKLRGATSEDWLIPVGNPALIMAAGKVWFDLTGSMNILVWDQQHARYTEVRLNHDGPRQEDHQQGQRAI